VKTPLELLRAYLHQNHLFAYIVPSNDPYFGEYIPDRYANRAWLSGFSGSAGTLAVTLDEAALWTDSRYFIQAEQEMVGRGIELKKLKLTGTETIEEWLLAHCPESSRVGIDGALFSLPQFERIKRELFPLSLVVDNDPFDHLWADRPKLPCNPAFLLDDTITGASVQQKHQAIVTALKPCAQDFILPVIALDEVAWLLNMRGADIPFNPLAIACAAVTQSAIHLFIQSEKLGTESVKTLEKQGVTIHPFDNFVPFLASYPKQAARVVCPESWSVAHHAETIEKQEITITSDPKRGGTITHLKSQKNETELNGFRLALRKEGVAWVRLWRFLEEHLPLGNLSEQILARKFKEFRSLDTDYCSESFSPIIGFAGNGALPHYAMNPNQETKIEARGFLLIDTGGHYLCGTTDTTRTIALGPVTPQQKRDYTAVLKGMIQLSMAKFPSGTRGAQLDILARGPIWAAGRSYLHGTGHGIGHFLNVHEGPQSIRMEENPTPLVPGMVLSNEPAIYVPDQYGIRTENMILCKETETNDYGTFYAFETLTRCPIHTVAIDKEQLGKEATKWLNDYHATTLAQLSTMLQPQEIEWLAQKTKPI
jgi:Xaa-Pro aminopeptidase